MSSLTCLKYLAAATMIASLGFSSQALASGSMDRHAMDQPQDAHQEPMHEESTPSSEAPKSGGHHHKKHRPHHQHHHKHKQSDTQKEEAHSPSAPSSK